MQTVAQFNPLTYMVDASRALLAGTWSDATIWQGWLAAVVTCAVGLVVGIRKTQRTV